MKVLFIGGTGIISSACAQLASEKGIDLYLFNRGQTTKRPVPTSATVLCGDIYNRQSVVSALGDQTFDAVANFIVFSPRQIEEDIDFFRGRTKQYLFISSASAYQKPIAGLPITESTPLHNPYWAYSRDKIACEERLVQAYREEGFPITIVRPSHTYDRTLLPTLSGGYTEIGRMRQGKPVIVHGDGTSLWVLTHHRDFAKGLVGLLGNHHAIGHAVQITSNELLTWNQIYGLLGQAAGVEPRLVHVPSEIIATYDRELGAGLLGDKAHSVIFDNCKIKGLVPDFAATIPFAQGAQEILAWYDADPAHQVMDHRFNNLTDRILSEFSFPGK